jgi:peroxiredoxin-like protein
VKPLPHRYEVQLSGGPTGYARVSSPDLPTLPAAPPVEYDGPGDAWSPEHLLLAAVETCFLFTLRAVARASKVPFSALDVHAEGIVDRQDGVTRFTRIVLRPSIVVPPDTDPALVRRVLEKSEKACLVTASLSTPVHLELHVTGS